jgi:hypothetical protein
LLTFALLYGFTDATLARPVDDRLQQRRERKLHSVEFIKHERDPNEPRWYGWQTLSADSVALGFAGIGVVSEEGTGLKVGAAGWLATYSLGPPLVHTFNGHVGKGLISLGMRAGSVFVAASTLVFADCRSVDYPCVAAVALLTAPIIVDSALLARHPRPRATPSTSWTLQPTLGFNRRALAFGVQGSF